mgnify:FL=1
MDILLFLKKIKNTKIKIITRNIDYNTISLILNNKEYQITSLRTDLISFGRQAYVGLTKDIQIDANRRDFTVNSLYLDVLGQLFDPFNGLEDIRKRKLRFIGDPIKRFEEDYLRILRFCRFYAFFSKKNISDTLKNKIVLKLNNIELLSNKRMKDELTKIFDNHNFHISLLMIRKLDLDRYILLDKNNRKNTKIHDGFKLDNFKTVKYIKTFGSNIINEAKLNLLSVLMPHLYNFDQLENVISRFELSKKTIAYYNFLRLIENLSSEIDIKTLLVKKNKKIKIFKIIWKMRNKIDCVYDSVSSKNRMPISWCKLGLFHILPFFILKELDIFNIKMPKCPIKRDDVIDICKINDYKQIDTLLFKGEEFWVNNNFNPSLEETLFYLKSTL